MNNKGFTLVELLATLVVLGLVMSVVLVSVTGGFEKAKDNTEDVFIDTIKDAMDMYIDSDEVKELKFRSRCRASLDKSHGSVRIYRTKINFQDVIDSTYKPITQADLVNPANKNVACEEAEDIDVYMYRDEDYVYYYSIEKEDLGCLKSTGIISNLPKINNNGDEVYYTCIVM